MISTQILQEYAATALQKLKQAPQVVLHQLHLLEFFAVMTVSPRIIHRAVELNTLYGLSFGDSQALAAAETSGCAELLSEDLNPGQLYSGIRCRNPFA